MWTWVVLSEIQKFIGIGKSQAASWHLLLWIMPGGSQFTVHTNAVDLLLHELQHGTVSADIISCPRCNLSYEGKDKRTRSAKHFFEKHLELPWANLICPICQTKDFVVNYADQHLKVRVQHFLNYHVSNVDPEKIPKCNYCPAYFNTSTSLHRHQRRIHKAPLYCEDCQQNFKNVVAFRKHREESPSCGPTKDKAQNTPQNGTTTTCLWNLWKSLSIQALSRIAQGARGLQVLLWIMRYEISFKEWLHQTLGNSSGRKNMLFMSLLWRKLLAQRKSPAPLENQACRHGSSCHYWLVNDLKQFHVWNVAGDCKTGEAEKTPPKRLYNQAKIYICIWSESSES